MAGRFRLYTDTDIQGSVVKALQDGGWDILRGIDACPEGTLDPVHFERAREEKRVLVSNDVGMKTRAEKAYEAGRTFPGMVWWPRAHYAVMRPGDFREAFEDLAAKDDPFGNYPIVCLKPTR